MQFSKSKLVFVAAVTIVLAGLLLITYHATGRETKLELETASAPTQKPGATQSDLAQQIDGILARSSPQQGRCGIFIMSLKDGHTVYSRDGDKLFVPASNMKIYTTAVALDSLGGDYRWRTSVYAIKQPDATGVVAGDLILYGRGAPDLIAKQKGDAPSLTRFADELYQGGIRHVRGDIIGDASYFRGEMFGIGWQWNDLQWYFGAEPSALTVNENSVEITISPSAKTGEAAKVTVMPGDNFVRLVNNAHTSERDARTTIGIIRSLSANDLRVWGEFPVGGRGYSAFLSVHDPALWAATLFKQALIARGIKVDGEARSRDFRAAEGDRFNPQQAFELAHQDSAPLREIVRQTNKESNNLFAELLLRTLGKERGTSVPDPDPRKNQERGDDEAGAAVVRSWLEHKGITTQGLAIRDGSGLSRLNLITPEATARLLVAITTTNSASSFRESLPIAGRDGTLSSRLKSVAGRVLAKTGSLTYTNALSGYLSKGSDSSLAFSILCNDATAARGAMPLIDEITTTITEFDQSSLTKQQK
jgi:D-alanyl-D-alanine carboxypeptidase/D-alanyl-D-alanine-endopeptidase (penicillin-binding protein 4)